MTDTMSPEHKTRCSPSSCTKPTTARMSTSRKYSATPATTPAISHPAMVRSVSSVPCIRYGDRRKPWRHWWSARLGHCHAIADVGNYVVDRAARVMRATAVYPAWRVVLKRAGSWAIGGDMGRWMLRCSSPSRSKNLKWTAARPVDVAGDEPSDVSGDYGR